MYEEHFGLKSKLFTATVEGAAVFVGPQQAKIMKSLNKGLKSVDAVVCVSGPVGVGKTTVVSRALESLKPPRKIIRIGRLALQPNDVLEFLLTDLGVDCSEKTTIQRIIAFRHLLAEYDADGSRLTVVVEDAERLGAAAIAELEALTAAEFGDEIGANIVLMGPGGLKEWISRSNLVRLQQRTRAWLAVDALSAAEVQGYLRSGVRAAAGDYDRIFGAGAAQVLHRCSAGIPRAINNICDSALALSAERGTGHLSAEFILQHASETLGIEVAAAPELPAETAREPAAETLPVLTTEAIDEPCLTEPELPILHLAPVTDEPAPEARAIDRAAAEADRAETAAAKVAEPETATPAAAKVDAKVDDAPAAEAQPDVNDAEAATQDPAASDIADVELVPAAKAEPQNAAPEAVAAELAEPEAESPETADADVAKATDAPAEILAADPVPAELATPEPVAPGPGDAELAAKAELPLEIAASEVAVAKLDVVQPDAPAAAVISATPAAQTRPDRIEIEPAAPELAVAAKDEVDPVAVAAPEISANELAALELAAQEIAAPGDAPVSPPAADQPAIAANEPATPEIDTLEIADDDNPDAIHDRTDVISAIVIEPEFVQTEVIENIVAETEPTKTAVIEPQPAELAAIQPVAVSSPSIDATITAKRPDWLLAAAGIDGPRSAEARRHALASLEGESDDDVPAELSAQADPTARLQVLDLSAPVAAPVTHKTPEPAIKLSLQTEPAAQLPPAATAKAAAAPGASEADIPELTLDNSLEEARKDAVAPSLTSEKPANKIDPKMVEELGRAKSLDDLDDEMAATLFGDDAFNAFAAAAVANVPANDPDSAPASSNSEPAPRQPAQPVVQPAPAKAAVKAPPQAPKTAAAAVRPAQAAKPATTAAVTGAAPVAALAAPEDAAFAKTDIISPPAPTGNDKMMGYTGEFQMSLTSRFRMLDELTKDKQKPVYTAIKKEPAANNAAPATPPKPSAAEQQAAKHGSASANDDDDDEKPKTGMLGGLLSRFKR